MKILINRSLSALIAFLFFTMPSLANPHCEVPCGIYEDSLRINLIKEHITTIEKATNQINELSKDPTANINQLVRWVNNKEKHAEEIQQIVSQYFLHQRVKMADKTDMAAYQKYVTQLSSLHQILVYAMKSKQTTDLDHIEKMRKSVHDFEHAYFKHSHKHEHPHKH